MGMILSFIAWLAVGGLMFRCLKTTKSRRGCAWCVGIRYTFLIGLLIVIKLFF